MFKKLFKEIARPFEYTAKSGKNETNEEGRANVGGQIINCGTDIKIKAVDLIQLSNFDSYLEGKGVCGEAKQYFDCLKWTNVGSRQSRTFTLNHTEASLDQIGIAVRKESNQTMKVCIIWKTFTVHFSTPRVQIKLLTLKYRGPTRHSTHHEKYLSRGLTTKQLQKVKNRLTNESSKHNLEIEAQKYLS